MLLFDHLYSELKVSSMRKTELQENLIDWISYSLMRKPSSIEFEDFSILTIDFLLVSFSYTHTHQKCTFSPKENSIGWQQCANKYFWKSYDHVKAPIVRWIWRANLILMRTEFFFKYSMSLTDCADLSCLFLSLVYQEDQKVHSIHLIYFDSFVSLFFKSLLSNTLNLFFFLLFDVD